MYYRCILCNSEKYTILEQENIYKTVQCDRCGFIYVISPIGIKQLEKHYDENYYKPWIEEQRYRRTKMWYRRVKNIKKIKSCGRILDIGCGDGLFLEIAKKSGFEVYGTEISSWAVDRLNNMGFNVKKGDILNLDFEKESFDIITLWHVLEHTTEPLKTMEKVYLLLKKSGVVFVAVPNAENFVFQYLYKIFKHKKLKYFSPLDRELHLFHFNCKTLNDLLLKTNFKDININIDFGTIEYYMKVLNYFSWLIKILTGKIYSNAIEAWAFK